ncbi:MAG: NAD(+) kinase [Gammaproteobacteria bacterium]|jgi:NAD+ kinase|nr:NAD(+) kinase [Gammaproteobacteria bacterium]MBT7523542.1 NAD(+) kinase [Gammaproteobacteria bacterium]MBT7814676.1 NAD(+) kinase [Gammaproteobacteria bacterium]|tara:strand:+ start:3103 stop:3966 length:864 start_codon:yes stop_codon:yes gene_type:complete
MFKNIAIISKNDDNSVKDSLDTVISYLDSKKIKYFLDNNSSILLNNKSSTNIDEMKSKCDIAFIIGGDGTLLRSAQYLSTANIPICGINRGRLGFLVDISPDHIEENLESILSDNYSVDERISLIGTVIRNGQEISKNISFNDVVIHSKDAVRMIEMDTMLDGKKLYTVNADGLVVSTPTGSTAYSLSCGGPILQPSMEALVMVPICPHLLSNRPIVIGMNSVIEIRLSDKSHTNASVTFDGQINVPIEANDLIKITKGEVTLKLIQPPGINFLSILREKLGWGFKP